MSCALKLHVAGPARRQTTMSISNMFRFLAYQQLNCGRGWRLLRRGEEALSCARRARYWHRCWIEQRIAERGCPTRPAALTAPRAAP